MPPAIKRTQQEIMQRYSKMLKPGGKLVYATCSILPSENQDQVDRFLASDSGKGFTFVKDRKILSHTSGYDGFYMALIERN
jgi:16S rRNA (cytosine967-C5)-methyltransferase